ncbi:MAG: DUF1553 domain-containing protein [Bryobacteraceae bacterium]
MKFVLLACLTTVALSAQRPVSLRVYPEQAQLKGAKASQQFLAIATFSDGAERDVTGEAMWSASQPGLAAVRDARLSAAADGKLTLTASFRGTKAVANIQIAGTTVSRELSFTRDVVEVLTKHGCNSAACHGGVKGRGGFKLSANALFPKDDYEWIRKGGIYQVLTNEVKGERVPRINLEQPEKSLLLTKASMITPHGGGKRFAADSEDFRTIAAWIRAGAPYGEAGTGPSLVALEVYPPMVALPVEGKHRILVTARFLDGHTEDFTHKVIYASNSSDTASVNAEGIVTGVRRGETAILIRAAGQLASASVGVVGPPIPNYPPIAGFNFIDNHILRKLKAFHILPSELSSDSEFLRRVCLDLTGTLPPAARAREFIASKDPKKREKVVDALIGSPEFVEYWTFRFSDLYRVAIFANGLTPKFSQKYWEWIRNNIETNRPYDDVARERLSAQGYGAASRHFIPYNQIGPPADVMAEEVRVFFGRRLDCAQCHNHPYENWSQDQFWGMAAFFGRLFKVGSVVFDHPTNMDYSSKDVDGKVEVLHPRTKAVVKPAFLDGKPSRSAPDANPRKELAEWMTAHPYFAEATVNRIWGYFFARGIVDPVDDFRSTNPPTHPELLTALGKDFAAHRYDLRHLMRTIVLSRTYQLSHRPNATNKEDVVNYSHSLPRALDAEVLLDAVVAASGVPERFATAVNEGNAGGMTPVGTRAIELKDPDMFFSRFLELYGRPNRGAIPERSRQPNLSQALHMLAGDTYTERLGSKDGRLAKMLATGATDDRVIEEFYLASFSRVPTKEELTDLKQLVAQRGDREAALREFVWALLSSREFAENH